MKRKLILVCIGIGILVTVPLLAKAIQDARHAAHTMECQNHLKQVMLALHNYHDTYLKMPPARMLDNSWRIRIHPFVESSVFYSLYRLDEPWNSEWNQTLEFREFHYEGKPPERTRKELASDLIPGKVNRDKPSYASWIWQCPSERNTKSTHTNYLMLVGDNAFGLPEGGRNLRDISDGLSTTIAVAESISEEISWLEPKDFDVETMSFQINDPEKMSISSHHPDGPCAVMADGHVVQLSPDLPPEVLKAMITINGGERIVADENAPGGFRFAK
ncbi:DUF1559 domain-containing protein [Bremerella sp. JC817]|uniref:DUF1559 family PulG-like putative transporter n=1 Tax=Bremerella sp. JC817 TaxID=3231756 RepID=UPI003457BDEF